MLNKFKIKLYQNILKHGKIQFKVDYHHKGHYVELPELGDFTEELEAWIAYEGLSEYLISNNIYYNFSGAIFLNKIDMILSVNFNGPYDQEYEETMISIDDKSINQVIGNDELKRTIKKFDPNELCIDFDYIKGDGFMRFSASYRHDDEYIDLHDLFVQEQIERLKIYCEKHVLGNIPILNVPSDLEQFFEHAYCQEGCVKYHISTGDLNLKFDDI